MTSSEEISSKLQAAITNGLDKSLTAFLTAPTDVEATNAIYSRLASLIEVESRRIIAENLHVEQQGGKIVIRLGPPLAALLQQLFGSNDLAASEHWEHTVEIAGWTEPDDTSPTRPYIDTRTKRPTRGRLML